MRDFLQKEIGMYNYFERVQVIKQMPLAKQRFEQGLKSAGGPPNYGSVDLLVEGFFSQLQDHFNVNTVPTVIRLTPKLLKPDLSHIQYPFCPLCLGVRDEIKNLLEVSSTIKQIKDGTQIEAVQSSSEWFKDEVEQAFCFGCKRMAIEAIDRDGFVHQLPAFVKANA